MTDIFKSKEYIKSRNAYAAQCTFEYFISILSTDAFLAKLLKNIGLSDSVTGLLSSLISFTFLFQLFSIPLTDKIKNVKKPVIVIDTVSQLAFASMYVVPFMKTGIMGKGITVTALILFAYLTLYLNQSICYKWGNSFVSPDGRGVFSATKEMISLLSGVLFTLGAGYVTDHFESKGNLRGAFVFLSAVMVLVCFFNFASLMLMKEKTLSESSANLQITEIINRIFKNKNCRNAIILTALSEFARYLTIGFMGTYKTLDLGFSVSKIQVFNVISCLGRFAISRPLGKLSDKKGYSDGYFWGNTMTFASFIFGVFTTLKTKYMIVPFTVLYQMSFAGTSQNTFNMMYCYVDEEYILPAMAINNSIRGIFGFIASCIGSVILDSIQSSGNSFCGFAVNGQQLLSAASAVLTAAALVFNNVVVSKQNEVKK